MFDVESYKDLVKRTIKGNNDVNDYEKEFIKNFYNIVRIMSLLDLYFRKTHFDLFREEDLEKSIMNRAYKYVIDYCVSERVQELSDDKSLDDIIVLKKKIFGDRK